MLPAIGKRRPVRPGAYVAFFLIFAAIVFFSHLPYLHLPYYWDEGGQFIPAALDLLHDGAWIPHSTLPNVHPPAVMAYLAGAWRLAGFHPQTTRTAMLLLASFAMLAAFLLAIELSREVEGTPAFLAVGLLCLSPLFFAQGMLAQLDAPAMLFTTVALLLFLQDRVVPSALCCVVLVLVKETGILAPMVFAGCLVYERRWKDASYYLGAVAALGCWLLALHHATGYWLGNAGFAQYNLNFPINPLRILFTLVRRLYHLFIGNFHWVGTLAILYAWRRSHLFASRSWRIAWLLFAAHVVLLTMLGGAILQRYLLPVMPILFAAMVAALSLHRPALRLTASAVLLAGVAVGNVWNPPYPFPYEDNLAFTDFLKLHLSAANYLAMRYPAARVHTVWPLSSELSRPELGFVERGFAVEMLPDLAPQTLDALDYRGVRVLVAYSRNWQPPFSFLAHGPLQRAWQGVYHNTPYPSMESVRARVPLPLAAHFERHGQWLDIYVNGESSTPRAQ